MVPHSKPIIVGFDATPASVDAVQWAAKQADRQDCPLLVLHAALFAPLPSPMRAVPDRPHLFDDEAKRMVEQGVELAGKYVDPARVTGHTADAGAVTSLVKASTNAELLVVGNRGHGRLGSFVLGSVAYSVTTQAHCPVVVIGATKDEGVTMPGPDHPVVVGVDGSESARDAVHFAAKVAADAGAPLLIATAYQGTAYPSWAETYPLDQDGVDYYTVMRQQAEWVTEEATQLAHSAYPELLIEEHTAQGHPATELSRLATGCGLVVVGSRGRGAFEGLVLGSVSHGLLHLSPCPVAVVR